MSHGTRVRALTLAIGILSIPGLDAQNTAPARIEGPWEGTIQVGAGTLRMRVVFTETPTDVRAVIDIPEQGAAGLPLSAVSRADSNIHFELPTPAARAVFDGRLSGNAISGTFAQGQVTGTFELTRIAPAATAPSVPYVEHEIAVTNGGVRLAGTLTVPQGAGPFPLVVMITGSGPQNRDEEILGFRIFQVIADRLARQGIAAYRYDDRGVGRSTGNISDRDDPRLCRRCARGADRLENARRHRSAAYGIAGTLRRRDRGGDCRVAFRGCVVRRPPRAAGRQGRGRAQAASGRRGARVGRRRRGGGAHRCRAQGRDIGAPEERAVRGDSPRRSKS